MRADAVGVWEGMTVAVCPGSPANRCNAWQKVTITLIEARFGSFVSEAPPPMLDYHCRVRFYGHGSAIVLQAPKDAEAQFLLPAEP
jgi:hypothetical protein